MTQDMKIPEEKLRKWRKRIEALKPTPEIAVEANKLKKAANKERDFVKSYLYRDRAYDDLYDQLGTQTQTLERNVLDIFRVLGKNPPDLSVVVEFQRLEKLIHETVKRGQFYRYAWKPERWDLKIQKRAPKELNSMPSKIVTLARKILPLIKENNIGATMMHDIMNRENISIDVFAENICDPQWSFMMKMKHA